MGSEAHAFALEASAEAKAVISDASAQLLSLAKQVLQTSDDLLALAQRGSHLVALEKEYVRLSCLLSELRYLSTFGYKSKRPKHVDSDELRCQTLPNELLLKCQLMHESVPSVIMTFPRLSRSANRLAIATPEILGTVDLEFARFLTLCQSHKPRCLGRVNVSSQFV